MHHGLMKILAINLPENLRDAITSALGEVVCHSELLSDAFDQLQNQDFTLVVCCISTVSISRESFEYLIGLTLISTRIVLVGDSTQLTGFQRYTELGIELLVNPSGQEIVNRLLTAPKRAEPIVTKSGPCD